MNAADTIDHIYGKTFKGGNLRTWLSQLSSLYCVSFFMNVAGFLMAVLIGYMSIQACNREDFPMNNDFPP